MRNFYLQTAREKYGLPDAWDIYKWEAVGKDAVRVTGAVAPLITRGKRKGSINWRNLDKATEMSVVISDSDITACKSRFEATTGLCSNCDGTGREWWGRSAVEGNHYRKCTHCDGNGNATDALEQALRGEEA